MKCALADAATGKRIRDEDVEPECGRDFCDACGDCLVCYGGDECLSTSNGEHTFIRYIERTKT